MMKLSECDVVPLLNNRGTAIHLATPAQGAEHVDVRLVRLDPQGPAGPYHSHDHSENIYVILSGRGRLTMEGKEHVVVKDDVVVIPPKTRHALSSAGPDTLCLIEIFAPAGNDFVPAD